MEGHKLAMCKRIQPRNLHHDRVVHFSSSINFPQQTYLEVSLLGREDSVRSNPLVDERGVVLQ